MNTKRKGAIMTKQQKAAVLRRVATELLKENPYWDRWELAAMLLAAGDRFLTVTEAG